MTISSGAQKHRTIVPLRNHPLMRHGRNSNWPPVWKQLTKEGPKIMKGEVGILTYVFSTNQLSKRCYLVIEYKGEHYVGALLFDDNVFCRQTCALLKRHLDRSVEEIGDLEVSFTRK
jgi:hypothetical protein